MQFPEFIRFSFHQIKKVYSKWKNNYIISINVGNEDIKTDNEFKIWTKNNFIKIEKYVNIFSTSLKATRLDIKRLEGIITETDKKVSFLIGKLEEQKRIKVARI